MSDTMMRASLGICVVAAAASITASILVVNGDGQTTGRACDFEVHQLLGTRDPLELQRAAILVRALRCDVARRWVPPATGAAS